jgi:acyl carrier protein
MDAMDRSDLQIQLADLAGSVFDCSSAQFTDETTASDIPKWDSLNHVKLLVTIENALGLRFGDEDLEDPKNWGEFVDMIAVKLSARPPAP